jgi:hypothetical protein
MTFLTLSGWANAFLISDWPELLTLLSSVPVLINE